MDELQNKHTTSQTLESFKQNIKKYTKENKQLEIFLSKQHIQLQKARMQLLF